MPMLSAMKEDTLMSRVMLEPISWMLVKTLAVLVPVLMNSPIMRPKVLSIENHPFREPMVRATTMPLPWPNNGILILVLKRTANIRSMTFKTMLITALMPPRVQLPTDATVQVLFTTVSKTTQSPKIQLLLSINLENGSMSRKRPLTISSAPTLLWD